MYFSSVFTAMRLIVVFFFFQNDRDPSPVLINRNPSAAVKLLLWLSSAFPLCPFPGASLCPSCPRRPCLVRSARAGGAADPVYSLRAGAALCRPAVFTLPAEPAVLSRPSRRRRRVPSDPALSPPLLQENACLSSDPWAKGERYFIRERQGEYSMIK